ncbi:MAG: 3-phosphoglycerate dehydrogenase family protein [Oscillospiraceae bacterium]|nr:3-phosphoglycerate dehydrogenase family protein [Oscillospiraceae bacterium]
MYEIKTMNNIARQGLNILAAKGFLVNNESADPAGLLLRSAKIHDMEFNKNLVAIARAGVGTDNVPTERCTEEGIAVFNTAGANAQAVVELAICSLVLASRDLVEGVIWAKGLAGHPDVTAEVEAGKKAFVGPEIMGKTLGVIGLGAIGAQIANTASNLGMTVWGYDPYLSVEAAWRLSSDVKHAEDLATIYRESDYVLIQVHHNESTHHMLDAKAFSQMKDGVRVINLARGGLVDSDAILAALASGKVARYVTDFPDDKVIGAKGVVAFPHLGASTPESEDKCAVMAAQELADYLLDGNVHNSVNLPELKLERAGACRVCIIHDNIPRMLNSFLDLIGAENINVEHMQNKAKGSVAYTVIDLGSNISEDLALKLAAVPNVKRLRVL